MGGDQLKSLGVSNDSAVEEAGVRKGVDPVPATVDSLAAVAPLSSSAFKFDMGESTNRGVVTQRRLAAGGERTYQCLDDELYSWWLEAGVEALPPATQQEE